MILLLSRRVDNAVLLMFWLWVLLEDLFLLYFELFTLAWRLSCLGEELATIFFCEGRLNLIHGGVQNMLGDIRSGLYLLLLNLFEGLTLLDLLLAIFLVCLVNVV